MGTLVEVQAGGPKARVEEAITAAFREIARIERMMSPSGEGELAQLNARAHSRPVRVSFELFQLLERSMDYHELTGGKFDITLGKLLELWGFSSSFGEPEEAQSPPQQPPPLEAIKAVLTERWLKLDREKRTVQLGPNAKLDLGGIAKGYAVDRAIEVLREHGVRAALVNAGGDIRVLGRRPGLLNSRPFKIAIQHPRAEDEILGIVELTDRAIATSGDYERYFVADGVRYHHILDPATGWPAQGCISVTVIAPTALEADALATGVFALGPEQGLALLERLPQVEGIIVTSEGQILKSEGLRELELGF